MTLRLLIVLFAVLTLTNGIQNIPATFEKEEYKSYIHKEQNIPFTLKIPDYFDGELKLTVKSTNEKVVKVDTIPEIPFPIPINGDWSDNIIIRGVFIGKADIEIEILYNNAIDSTHKIEIIIVRPERVIDTVFTASVVVLVSILYINFGCAMDWTVCKETLKKPIGPLIGSVCQFIIMPVLAFGIGTALFPNNPEMQLGIFFTGISPSGGASNIWTVLLGGNLNLSIAMTTLSTLASFVTMPTWTFTLGKYIFEKGNFIVPYKRIAYIAVGLVIPLSIGYLIQRKFPKLCKVMVRIMKPFSVVLILFIVIFAIVTNSYLFEMFSWEIVLAGMGLPWIGFLCGMIAMIICRQPQQDIRAIAVETGIQNTGIAIFLLRFSLKQPDADLTTVLPVACAIMTPIPLMILWMLKLLMDRKKKNKRAPSMEKLRTEVPQTAVTIS